MKVSAEQNNYVSLRKPDWSSLASQPTTGHQQFLSDQYGVVMNQLQVTKNAIAHHSELMAGALQHLRNAMETGSRRSCAVACMLFTRLSHDEEALGTELSEACKGLGECLEGLAEFSARRIRL
jgi:hypothetical protein